MRPREPPSRDFTIEHDRSAMADCIPMTTRSELAGVRGRIEPRGLSRIEAAIYVGVSPSLFDEMARDGRMPKPKRINSRTVWDRKRLDEAFEALPDDGDSDGQSVGPGCRVTRDATMARLRIKYVWEDVDRHGNVRRYFVRTGQKKTFIRSTWRTMSKSGSCLAALGETASN